MTKHTIKDFLDGQICVHCADQDDKQRLLQVCTEAGIAKTWCSTLSIQQTVAFFNVFYVDRDSFTLAIMSEATAKFCDVVPFSSLVNDTNSSRIVIEYSNAVTTATMYNGEKPVKSATINRHHNDESSVRIAAIKVIDKLLAKQGKQPKQEKPAEKCKFKVGDRVVYVGENVNPNVVGKHGTVMYIKSIDSIGIQFDEYVDGHGLESACLRLAIKHGYGWWCKGENLRHEQPTKPQVREVKRRAKAGEWVKIVRADGFQDEEYKDGDILQVITNGYSLDYLSCGGGGATKSEYVVLEGYKPEEPTNA